MVEGSAKIVKFALFLANFIILICGIVVFAVGVWTLVDRSFMERLLGSNLYVSSAALLITTGVIIFLISFLGCFGAIKEIRCMLFTFFIILFIIYIVMLVGGILGYVFRNQVEDEMRQEMESSIPKYGDESSVTDAWDSVQDYDCFVKMKKLVTQHAMVLGGIGVGISSVLILGMMLSCALCLMIG